MNIHYNPLFCILQHTVEKQPPLFENLKDSSHMKNGSPVLDPKDSNGWSIKGLGGRPKSAKQV